MGILYESILCRSNNRKRVRYEVLGDSEHLQPARRLQRRNAMRQLRQTHGEAVPLLMRSSQEGGTAQAGGRSARYSPYSQPWSGAESGSGGMPSAVTEGENHIRQLEETFSVIRSNLASTPGFQLPNFRPPRRYWNDGASSSNDRDVGSAEDEEGPRFAQYIQPPQVRPSRSRSSLVAATVRDNRMVETRDRSNYSRRNRGTINFDHLLEEQGERPSTRILNDMRGMSSRVSARDNPNRHAMVVRDDAEDDDFRGNWDTDVDAAVVRWTRARVSATDGEPDNEAGRQSDRAALGTRSDSGSQTDQDTSGGMAFELA